MSNKGNTYNSMVSGIVPDDYEGIESRFTQVSELPSLSYCRLVKAMRYGRWHVLKGLKTEYASDPAHTQRLRKELEMMMVLSHPSILQVYGMEQDCRDCKIGMDSFIVMEWVDGVTLGEWLATSPSINQRRRVADEMLDAISYMHRQGVVHRDLKPENIMITRNGANVKIIDFGLADNDSYAVFKNPAGTEQYIAPEQLSSNVADSRNDIYSLGIVLNLMHMGNAYKGVVRKCLMPISARFQSVDEIREDLERGKRHRRHARVAGFAIAVSVVIASILLGLGYAGRQKLENPSGNFTFTDSENFFHTNWDNATSTNTSVQYIGENKPQVRLRAEYRFNGNTWISGELGFGCFKGMDKIEDLRLDPPSFGIQKNAFKGCKNLKTITMPNVKEPPSIGNGGWQTVIDSVFEPYHYEQVTLYVPDVEAFRSDTSWSKFKHIEQYTPD